MTRTALTLSLLGLSLFLLFSQGASLAGFALTTYTGTTDDCVPNGTNFLTAVCASSTTNNAEACLPFLKQSLEYPPGVVVTINSSPSDADGLAKNLTDYLRSVDLPSIEGVWVSPTGTWSTNTTENAANFEAFVKAYESALGLGNSTGRFGLRATTTQMAALFGNASLKANLPASSRIWWVPTYSGSNTTTPGYDEFPTTNGFNSSDVAIISNGTSASCGQAAATVLTGRNLNSGGVSVGSSLHLGASVLGSLVLCALALLLL